MSQPDQDALASLGEQNKQIVRRLYEEVFNRGELSLAEELVQADARDLHDPQDRRGPERVKEVVRMLAGAFPDQRWKIADLIAEGDQVAMRSTWTGTHEGSFMGIPPTGRHASVQHMYLFRLADRKVVEYAAVRDDLSMMRQLDLIPAPDPRG
jgi:steroid delta-isomerase-like uncharacterized protein